MIPVLGVCKYFTQGSMENEYIHNVDILSNVRSNSSKVLTISCVLFTINIFSIKHTGYAGILRILGYLCIAFLTRNSLKAMQKVVPAIGKHQDKKRPYVVFTNKNSFVPVSSKTTLPRTSRPINTRILHINAKPIARKPETETVILPVEN